jgi:hypothetical protein
MKYFFTIKIYMIIIINLIRFFATKTDVVKIKMDTPNLIRLLKKDIM